MKNDCLNIILDGKKLKCYNITNGTCYPDLTLPKLISSQKDGLTGL